MLEQQQVEPLTCSWDPPGPLEPPVPQLWSFAGFLLHTWVIPE